MSFTDGQAALRALRTYLQSQIEGEPHATTFAGYGGADIILEDDEPTEDDQAGRPYIVLALESDDKSPNSSARRPRNDAAVRAEAVASDFNGAQTGAANPTGSDTKLSQAITTIIENDAKALQEAGFYYIAIRGERERIQQTDGFELHRNPHRITFTYFKS